MLRLFFIIFFLTIGLVSMYLPAQESIDWRSWTSVIANYKIDKSFRLRTKLEYRLKDNLGITDRWNANVSLNYAVLPHLEVEGSYELHHRLLNADVWMFRHRFVIATQASWKFYDFKLSWRERLQETLQDGNLENVLRSRLKLDYVIPQTCLQPYFSTEIFQKLNSEFPGIFMVRYRPGLKISLSKKYALVLFYCRQYEKKQKSNIAGVDFELNL